MVLRWYRTVYLSNRTFYLHTYEKNFDLIQQWMCPTVYPNVIELQISLIYVDKINSYGS